MSLVNSTENAAKRHYSPNCAKNTRKLSRHETRSKLSGSDASMSLIQFRYDFDTIFTKYRDIYCKPYFAPRTAPDTN